MVRSLLTATARAGTSTTSHTPKFTSVAERSISVSKSTGAQQDKDVNAKGKIIGFDELYIAFNLKTGPGRATSPW